MLYPAGPEEEEDDEEEDDDEEATDDEVEREEDSVDLGEYKYAMLELEGLKITDTHADRQDLEEEKSEKGEEQKETETAPVARSGEERLEKDLEEELKEAEDECPELADLSAANKEFKPFR